jgi:hypothetical protein
MSNAFTRLRQDLATRWTAAKPMVIGGIVGLVAGPIISGFAGFQVRTSTAEAATRAGIVEQQAQFCAERARAATPSGLPTDWQARNELARQWSLMAGADRPDQDVVYACSNRLSR